MSQQEWLRDVIAMLQRGDTAGAKQQISAELKRSPQNPDAWYLSSLLLNDPQKQKQVLERTLSYDPHHAQAQKRLDALKARYPDIAVAAPKQAAGNRTLLVLASVGALLGLLLGGIALFLRQPAQGLPAAISLADSPAAGSTAVDGEEPTITLRPTRTFRPPLSPVVVRRRLLLPSLVIV